MQLYFNFNEYKELQKEPDNKKWICLNCYILENFTIFLFTLVPDSVLQETNDLDILSNYQLSSPPFEMASRLTNLPNLSDYDIDENININLSSEYYSLQELAAL